MEADKRKEYELMIEVEQDDETLSGVLSKCSNLLQDGKEKEALAELEEHYRLLPFSNVKIFKYEGDFYETYASERIPYPRKTVSFDIEYAEKLDLTVGRREAIKNLRKIVNGSLSAGDKMIINGIAVRTFEDLIERSSDPEDSIFLSFYKCNRTDLNESALYELETYGFKVNPPSKFKTINLRSRDGD